MLQIGIREKILAAFVVLSLVPLLFLGSISVYEMNHVGSRSVAESAGALNDQARTHLIGTVNDKAGISNDFFLGIRNDTGLLQAYATDVFTNRANYGSPVYPSYRYTKNLAPNLPAYGYRNNSYGEGNGSWADWDHHLLSSPYINRSVAQRAAADPAYGEFVCAEMNTTVLLDQVLKPVYDRNSPDVVATWFVRAGGISTSYQVPALDWGYLLASRQKTADWDESLEEYYQAATPSRDIQKTPVWVGPYYDTVGNGWLISCVAPVYRSTEFVGVIGIDVTLDVVVSDVLGVSVHGGHAFLINKDGEAIAHRDLVATMSQNGGNPVQISKLETDASAFNTIVGRMKSGASGLQKVRYGDGKDYFVAYAPVTSTGFSLGAVIPVDEVSRPVRNTQDQINSLTSTTVTEVVVIEVVAIALAVVLGFAVAGRIVRPIKRLTDLASKLGTGELDDSVFASGALKLEDELVQRPDEIGELAKSFEGMINSIREDMAKTPKSEIKIEIKDSVINRSFSDMGANTKDTVAKELRDETADLSAPIDVSEVKDGAISDAVVSRDQLAVDQAGAGGAVAGRAWAGGASAGQAGAQGAPAGPVTAGPSAPGPAISCCPYCGKELNFPKPPKFCPYCREKLY
jgi:HAMP domain-containing protein